MGPDPARLELSKVFVQVKISNGFETLNLKFCDFKL